MNKVKMIIILYAYMGICVDQRNHFTIFKVYVEKKSYIKVSQYIIVIIMCINCNKKDIIKSRKSTIKLYYMAYESHVFY